MNIITTKNEDGEFEYTATIDKDYTKVSEANSTSIYLSQGQDTKEKDIPSKESLAESIAKRINLMCETSQDDPTGFSIKIEDIIIDKSYRDRLILKTDIKFKYKIPEDLVRFKLSKEDHDYIIDCKITGVVIAREKTVRIKENKGVVLFARNKLCQEATYLNINPSNNYCYALI